MQNLIVGLVLLAAIGYLTFSYLRRRRNKTGCSHCAIANLHADNDKPHAGVSEDEH